MPSNATAAGAMPGAAPAGNAGAGATPPAPILEARDITKQFPGCLALKGINLTVRPGEVLALLGENGAGKSTLMKILAGIQSPNAGEIRVDGEPVALRHVNDAMDRGIVLIHQELNLCDNLDVGANIFLGREPRRMGLIDRQAINERSKELLRRVSLDASPTTLVRELSTGQQQLVEIAKALSMNARVLIMDEPTSSLSHHETEALFRVVKELRKQGVSVIYISHRLGEILELADRVLVFRDGQNVGELSREELTHDRMVTMMVGRDISNLYDRPSHPPGEVVMEVDGVVTPAFPTHALSFQVRRGEILGISGLVGAGRTELLRVLFGVDRPVAGRIVVNGQEQHFASPRDAIRAGLALVPEDRKQQGLVLEMPVRENVGLAGLLRHAIGRVFLNKPQEKSVSGEMCTRLRIKTPSDRQIVQFLSGGNQQKVVLGKWLAMGPQILLLDEPTRGIDVGAKQEIYQLMEQLAGQGMAIVFVSSEMEEILRMSDRALVMHEGRITGELPRAALSEESVMQLATGTPAAV